MFVFYESNWPFYLYGFVVFHISTTSLTVSCVIVFQLLMVGF